MNTPANTNKEYFDFLDNECRTHGFAHMFGARDQLMNEFGLECSEATTIMIHWTELGQNYFD